MIEDIINPQCFNVIPQTKNIIVGIIAKVIVFNKDLLVD